MCEYIAYQRSIKNPFRTAETQNPRYIIKERSACEKQETLLHAGSRCELFPVFNL